MKHEKHDSDKRTRIYNDPPPAAPAALATPHALDRALAAAHDAAVKTVDETGEMRTRLVVRHQEKYALLPYDGSGLSQLAAIGTIRVLRSVKMFDYAILISEAWSAKAPKDWKPGDPHIRPSESPDKREVVIIHIVGDNGETRTGMWALERDAVTGKPRMGAEIKQEPGSCKSWLDEAVK